MKQRAKAFVWRSDLGWSFSGYVRCAGEPSQSFSDTRPTHAAAMQAALHAVGLAPDSNTNPPPTEAP